MSNVVTLRNATLPGEPVASVIEALELVLNLARAGTIRSVAIAATYDDGCIHNDHSVPEGERMDSLIGAVARLQWTMIERVERT